MYIRDLRIRNYLVHQDTAVSLSPLTVFVGPHGGGKSALFDAMLNFSMVSRGKRSVLTRIRSGRRYTEPPARSPGLGTRYR